MIAAMVIHILTVAILTLCSICAIYRYTNTSPSLLVTRRGFEFREGLI